MISKGQIFDTPFERGCVALEAPNSHGSFLALDSDGVKADFHIAMVENVRDANAPDLAAEVADALTPRGLRRPDAQVDPHKPMPRDIRSEWPR
jgi:hypothetical protein